MTASEGSRSNVKDIKTWSVADVGNWLDVISLGHLKAVFQTNGVNGEDLVSLTDEDFTEHLQVSPLQLRKIKSQLSAVSSGSTIAAATNVNINPPSQPPPVGGIPPPLPPPQPQPAASYPPYIPPPQETPTPKQMQHLNITPVVPGPITTEKVVTVAARSVENNPSDALRQSDSYNAQPITYPTPTYGVPVRTQTADSENSSKNFDKLDQSYSAPSQPVMGAPSFRGDGSGVVVTDPSSGGGQKTGASCNDDESTQIILFITGFLIGIPSVVGAFLPCCSRPHVMTPLEKGFWIGNCILTALLLVAVILLGIGASMG